MELSYFSNTAARKNSFVWASHPSPDSTNRRLFRVYERVTRPLKFYLYIEAGEGVNHSLHMTFRGAVHPPPTPKSTQ